MRVGVALTRVAPPPVSKHTDAREEIRCMHACTVLLCQHLKMREQTVATVSCSVCARSAGPLLPGPPVAYEDSGKHQQQAHTEPRRERSSFGLFPAPTAPTTRLVCRLSWGPHGATPTFTCHICWPAARRRLEADCSGGFRHTRAV